MIRGCWGSWKFRRWKPWLSPDVGEILWLVERSGGRDGAWGSGALAGGEGEILGSVNLLRRIRESRVYVPLFGRRKMRSVIVAREQAELWKTRDNGGKAAWLFIGVLSSVYWVSDVITDDELAVLIMRACSSRNLFVKHHLIEIQNTEICTEYRKSTKKFAHFCKFLLILPSPTLKKRSFGHILLDAPSYGLGREAKSLSFFSLNLCLLNSNIIKILIRF